jgi:hypothetical protein
MRTKPNALVIRCSASLNFYERLPNAVGKIVPYMISMTELRRRLND